MLAEEVNAQNESLEDYGLNNVFDDEYKDGFYESDGLYYGNPQWKTTKNSLIVSSGNILSMNLDSMPTYARIVYFNDSDTFVSYEDLNGVKNAKLKVPSGATKFHISMYPNTINIESIYINNAIDEIKNDLGKIKPSVVGSDWNKSWTYTVSSTTPKMFALHWSNSTVIFCVFYGKVIPFNQPFAEETYTANVDGNTLTVTTSETGILRTI